MRQVEEVIVGDQWVMNKLSTYVPYFETLIFMNYWLEVSLLFTKVYSPEYNKNFLFFRCFLRTTLMTPSIVVIFMDLVLHMCRTAQDMKVWQVIKTITLHPLWTILIRHQQTHRAISAFYCILQSASRTRKWQHFHGSNTLWQLEMEERVNILNP